MCEPISLTTMISLISTTAGVAGQIKSSKDKKRAAAATQKRAQTEKSRSDQELRQQRRTDMSSSRRFSASDNYSAARSFGPRSFFAS